MHFIRRILGFVDVIIWLPSTGVTLNAGVTLNTSLKQTLFSVKYPSRPRAALTSQCKNIDRFFFFFARLAQGHVTMTSSFQQNNSQK